MPSRVFMSFFLVVLTGSILLTDVALAEPCDPERGQTCLKCANESDVARVDRGIAILGLLDAYKSGSGHDALKQYTEKLRQAQALKGTPRAGECDAELTHMFYYVKQWSFLHTGVNDYDLALIEIERKAAAPKPQQPPPQAALPAPLPPTRDDAAPVDCSPPSIERTKAEMDKAGAWVTWKSQLRTALDDLKQGNAAECTRKLKSIYDSAHAQNLIQETEAQNARARALMHNGAPLDCTKYMEPARIEAARVDGKSKDLGRSWIAETEKAKAQGHMTDCDRFMGWAYQALQMPTPPDARAAPASPGVPSQTAPPAPPPGGGGGGGGFDVPFF
jgi:hypothetical protein